MNNNISSLKKLYQNSKSLRIGATSTCPSCGEKFIKKTTQQAFCRKYGNICKDNYWNNVTPTKRNNTTRISPANRAFYEKNIENSSHFNDYDDDQSWDAHKDSF